MGWELIWIPFVVALAASCMGFRKFVYFMSIGYGMAVAAIGVAFGVLSAAGVFQAGAAHYILFALLVVYGFRLSGFLLIRELKKKNPCVEKCIFSSMENVCLDTVLAYKRKGVRHSFLDEYDA